MSTDPATVSTPPTSKEEGKRFRVSQLNLQNTSIANELGTSTGDLDVEKAVGKLIETRKNNKLLTKAVIGLVIYSFVLTAAIFGVSIAAAEIAKDTKIDPSTGFVYAKDGGEDSPIMKTAAAVESYVPESIHGMSTEDLAKLLSVTSEYGALMFQVKGFSTSEEKTMLMVEGGVLTFDITGLINITGDHPNLIAKPFGVVESSGTIGTEDEGRNLSKHSKVRGFDDAERKGRNLSGDYKDKNLSLQKKKWRAKQATSEGVEKTAAMVPNQP
jgi:hypothetical protein